MTARKKEDIPVLTSEKYDEIIKLWNICANEEDRANIESMLRPYVPFGASYREFISENLLVSEGAAENRGILWLAGDVTKPLWARVDGPERMPIGTAVMVLRAARVVERGGVTAEGLQAALKEYESWPTRQMPNGGPVIHFKPPTMFTGLNRWQRKGKGGAKGRVGKEPEKGFWQTLRDSIQAYVQERTKELEPHYAGKLSKELEAELKTLLHEWQVRLDSVSRRGMKIGELVPVVRRTVLVEACRTLAMAPPPVSKPVNMKLARRNKMRLAREYHPDVSAHDTGESFNEVIKAYQVIEQYNEQFSQLQST